MWRAGQDHWSPWELRLSLYLRLGLHVDGWAGSPVALETSAIAIYRDVCHEGLEETGRRMMMMRSGFDIEF